MNYSQILQENISLLFYILLLKIQHFFHPLNIRAKFTPYCKVYSVLYASPPAYYYLVFIPLIQLAYLAPFGLPFWLHRLTMNRRDKI